MPIAALHAASRLLGKSPHEDGEPADDHGSENNPLPPASLSVRSYDRHRTDEHQKGTK